MPGPSLRQQNLDDLVARVQGLATVATADEVKSIITVFARCTLELSDRAQQLSEDMNEAQKILGERLARLTGQMKESTDQGSADMQGAKESIVPVLAEFVGELKRTRVTIDGAASAASEGTDALVRWTKVLVFATIVYVLITGGLLAVSLLQLRAVGPTPSGSPPPAASAGPAKSGNVH